METIDLVRMGLSFIAGALIFGILSWFNGYWTGQRDVYREQIKKHENKLR